MKLRQNTLWIMPIILLTSVFAVDTIAFSPSTQIHAPTIVDATLVPLKAFTVNITIVNVTNLHGWDVILRFNPAVLEAKAVTMPDPNFLGSVTAWTLGLVLPVIDNLMGTVKMGDAFFSPLPTEGVNGSATLATITFEVKAENAISPLTLDFTELYTVDVQSGQTILILHEAVDGLFNNMITLLRPVALFNVETPVANINEKMTFNASVSLDMYGEIVFYEWDFGDGTYGTGMIVDHVFTTSGIYTVKLTVTDNDNLTDAAEDYVTVLVHDIAITSVIVSQSTVKIGESVSISVMVANEGNFSETFYVTIYHNDHVIERRLVANLATGASQTLDVTWNTTDVAKGEYMIKAAASVVEGEKETHTSDNEYSDGSVTVMLEEAPPLPPNVFLYVGAAVVIIVMGATAIYLLGFKKSKRT